MPQPKVGYDRRLEHPAEIRARRTAISGKDLLGYTGTTDDGPPLKHTDPLPTSREIVGADQAVMTATNNQDVILTRVPSTH